MKKPLPSIEELHRLFECREDGVLIRKVTVRGKGSVAGAVAGNLAGTGYLQVNACCVPLLVHRVVWAMIHGEWPKDRIDHINQNKLDNRPSNLRQASTSQNLMNRGHNRNNRLGVKGVSMTASGTYHARIHQSGKTFHLGTYKTIGEASSAHESEGRRLYGEFYSAVSA